MKVDIGKLMPKVSLGGIVLFIVVLLMSTSVFAYPTTWAVSAPNVQQQNSNWCWDACSVCCIDYFGTPPTQSNYCITVKGGIYNVTAAGWEVCDGLEAYGYSPVDSFTSLSFTTIRSEIYNYNRPFIAGWSWNSGGGHMVVPCGYDDDVVDYVQYMDPWYGAKYQRTFTWFKGGTGSGSDHSWIESILNIN